MNYRVSFFFSHQLNSTKSTPLFKKMLGSIQFFFLVVPVLIILMACAPTQENTCVLKGSIVDRESKALLLVKSHEDARYMSERIPILEDNTFEYVMNDAVHIRYSLIFEEEYEQGAFVPIYFFPDNDTIEFKLYADEFTSQNTVYGSAATEAMVSFEKKAKTLFEPQFNAIHEELNSLYQHGQGGSERAKYLMQRSDSLSTVHINWRMQEVAENQNLANFAMLIDLIKASNYIPAIGVDYLQSMIQLYSKSFPAHLYNELASSMLTALTTIKVGGDFINFITVDSKGKEINIAKIVNENQMTILNFWAPWCGPCIRKSRAMIPFYEKYKDKQLAMVSVVGGIKNKDEYNRAIETDSYPWGHYLEINNQNKIWEKYNISNAGGGVFVVDQQGVILAIDPSIEELERLVEL